MLKKGGYPDKSQHATLDRRIAALAHSQHGHVTRSQLLDLGTTHHAIRHRLATGRLIPVHAGVYAVGHVTTTPVARAAAAVLACGPSAVLSHGSAVALWGFRKQWPTVVDVTAKSDHRRPGIHLHRSSTLARQDITRHFGIALTSPARTVYDVAPALAGKGKTLTRTVNDALLSPYLRPDDLAEVIDRNPGHQDCTALARELGRSGPTRSELEDCFRAFTERFSLPDPVLNTQVAGREVDALFPDEGVIVELDSWGFHGSRAAFEDDRERDVQMLVAGMPTVRETWERLTEAPEREAERRRTILRARAGRGRRGV